MKSTLGTMICFLVLGFFLMASAGRAEAARTSAGSMGPLAVEWNINRNTAGEQPGY